MPDAPFDPPLDSLSAKLADFADTLTDDERNALDRYLAVRASELHDDADVVGFGSPFDSLGDIGVMNSMQTQSHFDRQAKFHSTLSQMMKKQSDTSGSIIANMK